MWFGDGRYLLWSDIPNNRIMRWDEETGAVSVFRKPSNYSNGNTRDRQGRLLTCEHDARRVTRTEYDGTDHRDRRPLRGQAAQLAQRRRRASRTARSGSPIRRSASSATTRATSPSRSCRPTSTGSTARRASSTVVGGRRRPAERPGVLARRVEALRRRGRRSPRASSRPTTWSTAARAWPTSARSSTPAPARPTACACDVDGNLWCGWGMGEEGLDGVSVFNPDGKLIGRIDLPERCANLCFGGTLPQPAVHGGQHVALLALRQHPGRARGLSRGGLPAHERPRPRRHRPGAVRRQRARRGQPHHGRHRPGPRRRRPRTPP